MHKILIIQPAFLGDLILSTALIEKLNTYYPYAAIDLLLRKGYERILEKHPKIRTILVFNRKEKWKSLRQLMRQIRSENYDLVVNTHRHFSAGLLTVFSGAKKTVGFYQNPWSWGFHKRVKHDWQIHEINRNQLLIASFTDVKAALPRLYPLPSDMAIVERYTTPYISISPASLWATKQLPLDVWRKFIAQLPKELTILLMGGAADQKCCAEILDGVDHPNVFNIAGVHDFLEDVALMQHAKMNYVLDSAPLHICSAINAPVSAIFCSTSPSFGFGPLSENAYIIEVQQSLTCKPCGAHGHKKCPQGHFQCSNIMIDQLLHSLK